MSRYRSSYSSSSATLTWDNNIKAYKLSMSGPILKEFVELLKMSIPSSHRVWKPELKLWILDIDKNYFDGLSQLLRLKFNKVVIVDKEKVEAEWGNFKSTPVNNDIELQTFRQLLEEANVQLAPDAKEIPVIQKAYKKAALYFHPDRNPANADKMYALNSSFQALKPYFGIEVKQLQD